MEIPFLNLATGAKKSAISAVLTEIGRLAESADFILGTKVADFEARFAEREGAAFGVGCNSGLDAILLSLKALGIGPGDEVITSPFSFVATSAAISLAGATPVFADISWDGTLDPAKAEAIITSRTKAILPVLWGGIPGRLSELREICRRHEISLVLDAAQAVGTRLHGKGVGGWADAVCYSLHPLKNLGVWGDGGVILTDSPEIRDHLKLSRNHGLLNRDEAAFFSYNSRLDTVQAAVALAHLSLLDGVLQSRASHARRYLAGFQALSSVKIPLALARESTVGVHLFQVLGENRDGLRHHLADRGIETKVHYPLLIPFQKAAADLGYERGDFPVAEKFADSALSLPIREDLKAYEIDRIVAEVRNFYRDKPVWNQTPSELNS